MRMIRSHIHTALALIFVLGIAAPSAVVAQTTPPPAEEPSTWDKLREAGKLAGEAVREEAQRLRGQAAEALEDAGPTIEEAGRWARQLQGRLEVFTDQAIKDLNAGAQDLERRVREATGELVAESGSPQAVLPPADQLNADTRAAAARRPAGVVPDYVGVWAVDAAACARIDQDENQSFAVITPTTIRRADSVCNITTPALENGRATTTAACFADGGETEQPLVLELPAPETLKIGTDTYTRCRLPG